MLVWDIFNRLLAPRQHFTSASGNRFSMTKFDYCWKQYWRGAGRGRVRSIAEKQTPEIPSPSFMMRSKVALNSPRHQLSLPRIFRRCCPTSTTTVRQFPCSHSWPRQRWLVNCRIWMLISQWENYFSQQVYSNLNILVLKFLTWRLGVWFLNPDLII